MRFDSGDEFGFLFVLRSRVYVVVRWQCFEKKMNAAKKEKNYENRPKYLKTGRLSPSIPLLKYLNKKRDGRVFWPS